MRHSNLVDKSYRVTPGIGRLVILLAGGLLMTASGLCQVNGDTTPEGERAFLGEVIPKPQFLAEVTAPLWGRIIPEEGVFPGARVAAGQPLAELVLELSAFERLPLDDRTLDIDGFLERARQRMRFALRDYQRALKIKAENPDFEPEVERRKAVYQNALKAFQLASQQQNTQKGVVKSRDPKRVSVTSPLNGYILEQHFVIGEVNPTDTYRKLYTVVDLSRVWVRVEAYEGDIDLFQSQTEVAVQAHGTDAVFKGHLQSIGSEIDPASRTLPVLFEVNNPGHRLKIGQRVQVRLGADFP